MARSVVVVAIGGNSLLKRRNMQSVEERYDALCEIMGHVADLVEAGKQVLITYDNGPQMGFMILRAEIARAATGMSIDPLSDSEADTQGGIGYQILQALGNELRRRNLPSANLAALVTQTRVDPADPAMDEPSKFVGEYYDASQIPELHKLHPDWILKTDDERGWRRVVPAPKPVEIVEMPAIRALLEAGFHVIAAGGGGIPVINSPEGLHGIDAVLDKDEASTLLASQLGADMMIISTAVDQVCLNFGTPDQTPLGEVDVDSMEKYCDAGHFPDENMGAKIRAAIEFLRNGGSEVIITTPRNMRDALLNGTGTHIRCSNMVR